MVGTVGKLRDPGHKRLRQSNCIASNLVKKQRRMLGRMWQCASFGEFGGISSLQFLDSNTDSVGQVSISRFLMGGVGWGLADILMCLEVRYWGTFE